MVSALDFSLIPRLMAIVSPRCGMYYRNIIERGKLSWAPSLSAFIDIGITGFRENEGRNGPTIQGLVISFKSGRWEIVAAENDIQLFRRVQIRNMKLKVRWSRGT